MCFTSESAPCTINFMTTPHVAVVQPTIRPPKEPYHGKMCSNVGAQARPKKHSGDTEHTESSRTVKSKQNATYFCNKDFYVQIKTLTCLHDSCYYYGSMSSSEAKSKLRECPIGRFIIRDSSDPNYLYTISVKTKRGPTSIRVLYECGKFSLDADEKSRGSMPTFSSLLELIDYYVRLTAGKIDQCRFLDRSGRKDLPIILDKPRLTTVPCLKSICRTSINQTVPAKNPVEVRRCVEDLPLPKPLISYLKDHPFIV